MKSFIELNKKSGSKCLAVFYDRHTDNFNQAIEKGLSDHGLKHGEATIIAFPKTMESTAPEALNP